MIVNKIIAINWVNGKMNLLKYIAPNGEIDVVDYQTLIANIQINNYKYELGNTNKLIKLSDDYSEIMEPPLKEFESLPKF